MTTPYAALAYQVLDHIDAHPEQWKQSMWIGQAECGTVGCFAGWVCLLSGEEPDSEEYLGIMLRSGMIIPDKAEELLGANRFVDLGVDDEHDLFDEGNTREDLGRLVAEIFGPRPRPWTPDEKTETGTRIHVKRACNGCGELIGDVTDAEMDRAVAGLRAEDVRAECPRCWKSVAS